MRHRIIKFEKIFHVGKICKFSAIHVRIFVAFEQVGLLLVDNWRNFAGVDFFGKIISFCEFEKNAVKATVKKKTINTAIKDFINLKMLLNGLSK